MPPNRPIICAHRGVSSTHPENTLAAIAKACDIGALQTEIDVRRTSDGHLVLMHDESVDRTTSGTGPVSSMTLADIKSLDAGSWKSEEFAGETVPTLPETLQLCRERGMFLCIEIKQDEIAPEVVRDVEAAGMLDNVIIIAFNFNNIAQVRQVNTRIPTGFLVSRIPDGELDTIIGRCLDHGIPVISSLFTQVTEDVVTRCRLRGIPLYAWTIDDPDLARDVAATGVDLIASNTPAEIMAALS